MLIFARKVTYMYRGALTKFVFANPYKYLFCVRIMNAFYNARERETVTSKINTLYKTILYIEISIT